MAALVDALAVPAEAPRTTRRGRHDLLALLPGLLLATLLTAWRFDAKPMWRDEWYTLGTADRPLADVLSLVSRSPDVGLAGYHSTVHAWLLLGDGSACPARSGRWCWSPPRRRWPVAPGTLHPIAGLPAVVGMLGAAFLRPGAASRREIVAVALPAAVTGSVLVGAALVVAAAQSSGPPPTAGDLPLLLTSLTGGWWLAAGTLVAATAGTLALRRPRRGAAGRVAGPTTLPAGARWPGDAPVLLGCLLVPLAVVAAMGLTSWFYALRYVSAATVPARAVPRAGRALHHRAGRALSATAVVAALVPLLVAAGAVRTSPYFMDDPRSAALALAAQHRPGDAVVCDGTTSRGLTYAYLPPGAHVRDTLLAATPLEAGTVYGRDLAGARARSALARHDRPWITGTIGGSGTWNSPRTAAAWERGRVRVEHRAFGHWWLELWALPTDAQRAR